MRVQLTLGRLVACGLLSIVSACSGSSGGGVEVPPPPPPSSDADLTNLSLSAGDFDQIFQPAQTDYTATVSLLRSTTTVTATPSDPNTTITVNGAAVAAGSPSAKISLNEGSSGITAMVTAEDGVTTTAYTIDVTRETAASFAQRAYIKASNTEAGDFFGNWLTLDGDTLTVAARYEDSGTTGVNGDQADNSASNSGAVYVFTRDASGMWNQQAFIKASNTGNGDQFGFSLALDGDTLAVEAHAEDSSTTGIDGDQADNSAVNSGAVYVFTRDASGAWSQQAYVKASNTEAGDFFGLFAVALDGDTLAIGARGEDSGAAGVDGDQADNSAANAGAVYVFTRDAGAMWTQQAYIKASNTEAVDGFGSSLALDGDTLAVGALAEDSSVTGIDGDQADNSAVNSGAVYVFTRDASGVWSQQAYIKASNTEAGDRFGHPVALDGATLAVAAYFEDSSATGIDGDQADNSAIDAGAVYVFTRDAGGEWSQQAYIKASNTEAGDFLGWLAVALEGDTLAVGASAEDSSGASINGDQADNNAVSSGAAYVFTRDASGVWRQQAYIKPSNTGAGDRFGLTIALDGDTVAVGTENEDSSAVGIEGDQADNSALDAGGVYVFK